MTTIRPGRDSKPVSQSFEPQQDRMRHPGRPQLGSITKYRPTSSPATKKYIDILISCS